MNPLLPHRPGAVAAPAREPRAECLRCGRPKVVCWCAHVREIRTRTRVVILQHPRERHKPIGTARMAHLSLVDSELHVGLDFDRDPRVARALQDPAAPAALLYPGPGAVPLETLATDGPRTLVLIDGTWAQARTLFRLTRAVHRIPCVRLDPPRPSEYRIRPQSQPDHVSTIEALYFALRILEPPAVDLEPLLAPFRAMIDMQLDCERKRRERGLPHRLPT